MTTGTLKGERCFVTYIDDHSKKVWAYELKTKDKLYDVFKKFNANIQGETNISLNCICKDDGKNT